MLVKCWEGGERAPGRAHDSEELTRRKGHYPRSCHRWAKVQEHSPEATIQGSQSCFLTASQHPQNCSGINRPYPTQGSWQMVSARLPAHLPKLPGEQFRPGLELGGWFGGLNCKPSRGKARSLSRAGSWWVVLDPLPLPPAL